VQDAATVLAGLSSARTPWLTLALAGPADHGRLAATAADPDVTVIDITNPQAACGERCGRRSCTGYEVHAAALLADEPGQAWLRLWVRALVLAFLAGRPVPGVPGPLRPAGPLRAGGRVLSPRGRECLLATVIDAAAVSRGPDDGGGRARRPARLAGSRAVLAGPAHRAGSAGPGGPRRPGSGRGQDRDRIASGRDEH